MKTVLKLKAMAAEKRAEAQRMLDAIASGTEFRSLSPEDQTKFDALLADVEAIKKQMAVAKKMDDDDAAEEEDEAPPAESRSLPIRRSNPVGEAPAIHAKKQRYSILRALRLATDHKPIDGLEGEISAEISKRSQRPAKGFFMPTGSDPEMRALMYPGQQQEIRRDLSTSTGAGGIFLTPELPLIELLRAKLVIRQLGAKFLTDMHGTFAIPRQNAKATVYWLGEGSGATGASPGVDQVPFTPKVAIALTNMTRQFMNQTSLDAEGLVKDDLAESMSRELDRVAIRGTGGNQPTGITQNSTIITNSTSLAIGANGGALTYNKLIDMETLVASYNADRGSLGYLTSPAIRGYLKETPKIAASPGFPIFIWQDGREPGVGEVNGYPAYATTNCPTDLTKGTGSALKSVIFGNFNDLIVCQWEGVDMLVNPYTNQASGGVIISMEMSVDVEQRHPESFAVINDAT